MKADKRYYLNADRSRVVEEGDPEAAYLLAHEGGDIPTEDAKRYRLGRYADEDAPEPVANVVYSSVAPPKDDEAKAEATEPAADDDPGAKAVTGPPANKARAASVKKADEDK